MPPLNQSLWALLIASLTAFIGWGVVHFSALVERERRKRHNERDRHLDMTSMERPFRNNESWVPLRGSPRPFKARASGLQSSHSLPKLAGLAKLTHKTKQNALRPSV
jgi:hypothetical protein